MEAAVTAAAFLYVIGGCLGSGVGQRRKCTQECSGKETDVQSRRGCRQAGETPGSQREMCFLSDTGI